MTRTILALCLSLLGAICAHAFTEQPAVNPATYHSASGKYALYVDPSDRDGRGPAFYRLSTKKGVVWSGTLPFTFTQAIVSERGVFAGYAHTEGINGLPLKKTSLGPGEIVVATIGPDGKVRHRETTKRQHSAAPDAPPEPIGVDLFLHESADRFSVRRSDFSWQFFSLSTGRPQAKLDPGAIGPIPETARLRTSMRARALPGTPLSLANWVTHDEKTNSYGLLFMLVHVAGHAVWSLHQPAGFPADDDFPWEKLTDDWAILKTSDPHRFDLWFYAEQQRVTFSVDEDPKADHGWRVAEVAREKYTPPEPPAAAAEPAIVEFPLPQLGTFVLQDGHSPQPIRGVDAFAFDEKGRIGFLRPEGRVVSAFVLLEPDGHVAAEIALPEAVQSERVHTRAFSYAGGGKWILCAATSLFGETGRAWRLDFEKRAWTELPGFEGPPAKSITGLGDGGFVGVGDRESHHSVTPEMRAYDGEGKPLWKVDSHTTPDQETFQFPEALTTTSAGELALLEKVGAELRFFDKAGKHLRTIDLNKAWGREARSPSAISPDKDGGVIVQHSYGTPQFVRMSSAGVVVAQMNPSAVNRRVSPLIHGLAAAPDGQLWAADGHSLFRLDDEGHIVQTLGAAADPRHLGNISAVGADAGGRLSALDQQTGDVYVFDPDGRLLHTCQPSASDRRENRDWTAMQLAADGSVLLRGQVRGKWGHLHFDPRGRRLSFEQTALDREYGGERHPQPGADRFLVTDLDAIYLTNAAHKLQRKIQRRADGNWLDLVLDVAVASDGAFAVLTQASAGSESSALSLYQRDGRALRTTALPWLEPALYGYNGTHFVLRSHDNEVVIYTVAGAPVQRFSAPHDIAFLAKRGRELWLVEYEARRVSRFAMP